MFRSVIFYDNFTDALTGTWRSFLAQGVLLAALGLLVLFLPQLLVAMVSASLMLAGGFLIAIALRTRAARKNYRRWRDEFWQP